MSSVAIPAAFDALRARARTARRAGASGARRVEAAPPAVVLAPLVAAQLGVVAVLALRAEHNGWLYSTPREAADAWTAAWALGHLWVPGEVPAYGLAALLWPLALVLGASLPAALPALVVLQAAVAGPLVLLALYGIAGRIAGRFFGYAAALAWVVGPLLSLGFFYSGERVFQGIPYSDYRATVGDVVVPHAVGLAGGPAWPSLVALAGAAWLLVRCLDTGKWSDALASGLVAGFAVGIDADNALFLPAPLLALAVARRPRQALGFGATLLPALATLALWRWTGSGELPRPGGLSFHWDTLRVATVHFRGAGWSLLLVVWIAVAGSLALVRKASAKGVLVVAWFAAFFVLAAGSAGFGTVLDGSLLRALVPAFPAFALLAAGVFLLVPTWGRPRRLPAPQPRPFRVTRGVGAAAVVLAAYPLALVALAGPAPRDRLVVQAARGASVAVSDSFAVRVERRSGRAVVRWRRPPADGVELSYRVYSAPGPGCAYSRGGAGDCRLRMAAVATVRETSWTDAGPPGSWYRVAALADHRRGRVGGEPVLISPPVR